MFFLQFLIHRFEMITRSGYIRAAVTLMAALLIGMIYDLRNFKNLSTPEGMDNAQIARNLAQGRGYTTYFVRPFSLFLLDRAGVSTNRLAAPGVPDISTPPVYPAALAGLMKIGPFRYDIEGSGKDLKAFWGSGSDFRRFEPDFVIAIFNQILLLGLVAMTFLWARVMFDSVVAWASAALLLGTELMWGFSISGLSTIFLMLVFMGLVCLLTVFDRELANPKFGRHGAMILAGAIGVTIGIGALTRYSFAWLLIPTLLFVFFASGPRAVNFCLIVVVHFAVVLTPWVIRNFHFSGTPFGTAGYSALADTALFPNYQLERSLEPNLRMVPALFVEKVFSNLHAIRGKLIGTGWVTPVFLVSLFIAFNNVTLRRMRYFALACFAVLVPVESVVRTHLSTDSPIINSENLLILLLPLTLIYAVSFVWMLLERLKLPDFEVRLIGVGLGLAACLPMLLALMKGERTTLAYPPYHPAIIQEFASWMKPDELMMSDVPWAVAWYGDRPCVWLTRDTVPDPENPDDPENMIALSREYKPVHALFLTPLTLNAKLVSEAIEQRVNSWGKFAMLALVKNEVPDKFPLHQMPVGFLPEHLLLSDAKRWQEDVVAPQISTPIDPSLLPQKEQQRKSLFDRALKPRRSR